MELRRPEYKTIESISRNKFSNSFQSNYMFIINLYIHIENEIYHFNNFSHIMANLLRINDPSGYN